MRIANQSTRLIILQYRDGRSFPIDSGAYLIRPDLDVDYLDDSAATLALFSSGQLVLQNTNGSAWAGASLPSTPSQPPAPSGYLAKQKNPQTGLETLPPTSAQILKASGYANSLTSRVRASAAAARSLFGASPWIEAPAWVGGTAYAQQAGYVVQNGGNRYFLAEQGTAAASGGPTGTGAGPITDGSCKWYYDGPVMAVQSDYPAPTAAIGALPSGLTKTVAYNTAGAFFFTGGTPTVNSFGYRFPAANRAPANGNAVGTYDCVSAPVSFVSDAPKIALQLGNWYAGNQNTALQVEVDGRLLRPGLFAVGADASNTCLSVDWGGVRKMRKYRVWLGPNWSFYGVRVDPASVVTATRNPNRFRLATNGDSLTAGAYVFPAFGRGWMDQFAAAVGCDDYYTVAVGGTGFLNTQGGSTTSYIQRLPDVLGFAPDVHIVAGMYNDLVGYSSIERQAAILAYIQQFRAGSAAPLFLFGTTPGSGGAASYAGTETDMQAAILASGDANTVFFPVSTGAVPWIDGTGNVGAPAGNGNADVYILGGGNAPHYTQGGIDYVTRRYADAWLNYWGAQA